MPKLTHGIRAVTPRKIRTLIYRIGHFLHEPESFPSIEASLRYLKRWGFEPSTVMDVGAYHGDWTRMFKRVFPASRILMIEAQAEKSHLLQLLCASYSGEVFSEMALLGANGGQEVEFVQMETGSSVFEEVSPYDRTHVMKTQVTLDSVIERHVEFRQLDFLKLDVQGYELEVLKGASELLKHTEFVLVEASLIPINRGCPLILEVIEFLAARGFRLLDFCSQTRRRDGALWQTDLLFISDRSDLLPKADLDARNWG